MPASQVSVTTTPTLISPGRVGKKTVIVQNHGATEVFVGDDAGVTTATGFKLPGVAGASLTLDNGSSPLYGVVASGAQTVSVMELSR